MQLKYACPTLEEKPSILKYTTRTNNSVRDPRTFRRWHHPWIACTLAYMLCTCFRLWLGAYRMISNETRLIDIKYEFEDGECLRTKSHAHTNDPVAFLVSTFLSFPKRVLSLALAFHTTVRWCSRAPQIAHIHVALVRMAFFVHQMHLLANRARTTF